MANFQFRSLEKRPVASTGRAMVANDSPCLFCSKQSWAIKWQDVAWTCLWLWSPSFPFSGWFFQLLCTFLCAQGVLVLPVFCCCFFFPSRGCFSYCSVHFLSRFVIFAIFFFFYYLHLITLYFAVIMNFGGSFVYSSLSALWLFGLVSSVRLQSLQSLHRENLIKYQLQWLHHRIFGYRYLLWNSRKCLHVFKRMLHTSLLKGTQSSPLSQSGWL